MNKAEIYQQISEFNNTQTNPDNRRDSKSYLDSFLYVNHAIATERAKFFTFFFFHPPFNSISLAESTVLDLAFGSGSLSTHIMLESKLAYQKLILNDKFENSSNQEFIAVHK